MNYLLSLGANLGDRLSSLNSALNSLNHFGSVLCRSSFYWTTPYGITDQPPFINIVCSFSSQLRPQRLLRKVKQIELETGRIRTSRWGPRIIDIDLLEWDGEPVLTDTLTLPHADLENRAFVLIPLSEIAPSFQTRQGVPVSVLIKECTSTNTVTRMVHDDGR